VPSSSDQPATAPLSATVAGGGVFRGYGSTPAVQVLMHPKVSLTPHIGAATLEAQDRIGEELADQIIALANA
jgi:phosphoglycerate dehydrogenase-like enzyme